MGDGLKKSENQITKIGGCLPRKYKSYTNKKTFKIIEKKFGN